MAGGTFLASWQLSATRSHACAMWARVTRAPWSQTCAPSLSTVVRDADTRLPCSPPLPLPVRPLDDKTLGGGNWFGLIDAFPEAVGSGGSVRQHVGEHMESVFPDFRQICHGGHRPHLYRNAKRAPHTSIRGTNFMEDLPGLPDQSALTPANFTTLPHFLVSP